MTVEQCFSIFVRPWPCKFFFQKTRARSQQIYSHLPFHFFKFIHLTNTSINNELWHNQKKVLVHLMYTVWHVDKYKITFKIVINHWTKQIL